MTVLHAHAEQQVAKLRAVEHERDALRLDVRDLQGRLDAQTATAALACDHIQTLSAEASLAWQAKVGLFGASCTSVLEAAE